MSEAVRVSMAERWFDVGAGLDLLAVQRRPVWRACLHEAETEPCADLRATGPATRRPARHGRGRPQWTTANQRRGDAPTLAFLRAARVGSLTRGCDLPSAARVHGSSRNHALVQH